MTDESLSEKHFVLLILAIALIFVFLGFYYGKQDPATLGISALAVMLGASSLHLSLKVIKQVQKAEEIKHIGQSLVNFYRPLQNLFNCHDDNPINVYEGDKEKYNEIGCYRHLAEPDARRYFETCPQTNESLKDLLRQVREDIPNLENKYKQLK
ncbi:hypothetical protein EO95_02130 [Methanosarcina sp. 1.H.T.1A.1]|uniref:hypothetical protein n=1 Tax=Methanosarcina sp. 1.H.T.1A.1 TaxID=1483602 RepID=UPI00062111B4|nr:hypothetical protein [Methanosarcina sp. 1.H.T.1A.1]KKH97989.1 hypothetical protein EO95_02130 [Methanosarcina sp. 1.H.T.1A.1]